MQIEDDILNYIKTELSQDAPASLSSSDSLLDSGILDSLSIVLLTEFIETHFKVKVNAEDLNPDNFESVDNIAALVRTALN